jgi:hypothetical protein
LVVIGLWHFVMPVQEVAAFVAGRLERLYNSEERRRGIRIGVLWDASAWGDVRHAGHFVQALPFGLNPGTVIRVEAGDRLPGWEPGRSLAVGRDVLLSHLGRGMRETVRVALPAEGQVLESGVTLVGRDEVLHPRETPDTLFRSTPYRSLYKRAHSVASQADRVGVRDDRQTARRSRRIAGAGRRR